MADLQAHQTQQLVKQRVTDALLNSPEVTPDIKLAACVNDGH